LIDWDDSVMGIQNLDNAEVAHLDVTSHATETFVPHGQHDSSVIPIPQEPIFSSYQFFPAVAW
jgi:hypothetical protein